jgi:hypothetical protein
MDDARLPRSALTLTAARREMRAAYLGGGPGILVSGTVWFIAGCTCLWHSPRQAVWTLFVGGMLIHPLAVLLLKGLGRPGTHTPGNPLGPLAMASTFWMILSLPLAYIASTVNIDWFFPAMLLVIERALSHLCDHLRNPPVLGLRRHAGIGCLGAGVDARGACPRGIYRRGHRSRVRGCDPGVRTAADGAAWTGLTGLDIARGRMCGRMPLRAYGTPATQVNHAYMGYAHRI